VNIYDNNLTSLDISNDPGLTNLDAHNNYLNQEAIDRTLQTLDSYKTKNGHLDLTGNTAPSIIGIEHANNLTTRGWNIQISSKNNLQLLLVQCQNRWGNYPDYPFHRQEHGHNYIWKMDILGWCDFHFKEYIS
jgi:hypothetical protein